MKPQFKTLLPWANFDWPKEAPAQHTTGKRPLVALGAMLHMLPSSSYGQEPTQQHVLATSGQQLFNNACRTCHTIREGDNRLGPHLYKIIGRKTGSLPDYSYSTAMEGADFVWDEEKLKRFMANPDELVPGNSMKPYGGLASTDDREGIVSFLQSVASGR